MSREAWANFNRVYVESGWQRFLPAGAIAILLPIASRSSASREELDDELRGDIHSAVGLESDAWEPLSEFTDEELLRLDEDFEGTPLGRKASEPPRTAAEVNESEWLERQERIAELDSFGSHLGLTPVRSLGDLLAFMTAAGVVLLDSGRYQINRDAPLPDEVLPLSEARRGQEARFRWARIHEGLAQQIIALFKPNEHYSVNSLSTTVEGLALHLAVDPQSVREALTVLVENGDFIPSADPLRAESDQSLEVQVDWDAFHSSRISLSFGDGDNEGG